MRITSGVRDIQHLSRVDDADRKSSDLRKCFFSFELECVARFHWQFERICNSFERLGIGACGVIVNIINCFNSLFEICSPR